MGGSSQGRTRKHGGEKLTVVGAVRAKSRLAVQPRRRGGCGRIFREVSRQGTRSSSPQGSRCRYVRYVPLSKCQKSHPQKSSETKSERRSAAFHRHDTGLEDEKIVARHRWKKPVFSQVRSATNACALGAGSG